MASTMDGGLPSLPNATDTPEALRLSHATDISEAIWNRMQELGINQTQLAEMLGKSCSQVSRMISADGNMTLKTISELEHVLGITLIDVPPRTTDELTNEQTIEVFLYQMKEYRKIAGAVKLSRKTTKLELADSPNLPDRPLSTSDYAAMSVRLMLQRKHFVFGSDIHVRDVIKAALELCPQLQDELNGLYAHLNRIKQHEFETTHSDGKKTSDYYHNAEETLYGVLLHSDIQKIEHVADFSPELLLAAITPFILERERILCHLSDLLESSGLQAYKARRGRRAQVLRFTKSTPQELRVEKSPYWSNLIARDGTPDEFKDRWDNYDKNTREIILTCFAFVQLLRCEPRDITSLGHLIHPSTKKEWGDFSQAAGIFSEYPSLGMSDHIELFNLKSCAKVKLFPNVDELIVIDTLQLVSLSTLVLRKHRGKWKVWGLSAS